MKFEIEHALEVLSATPGTLRALLGGLSGFWTASGGAEDWQAFDIVGHLVHGEKTDWIPRARVILEQGENGTFEPFDRFAQFEEARGKRMEDLLAEFAQLRERNLGELRLLGLTDEQLGLKGMHPELGEVTLSQLIATWAVHDLNHIRQITTVMARKYDQQVGPWKEYLGILNRA